MPTELKDLGAWQVHADQLIERGERLGSLLAHDLSLGDDVTREQLVAFHEAAAPLCRVARSFEAGWMLGHARTLALIANDGGRLIRRRTPAPIDANAAVALGTLLTQPALSQLEQLTVLQVPVGRPWRLAMERLPGTCRRLELTGQGRDAAEVAEMMAGVPRQIEVLRLRAPGPHLAAWVDDRFAWVDLRSLRVTASDAVELAGALARTTRVRLRLGAVADGSVLTRLGPRAKIGEVEDARLVEQTTAAVTLLERSPLIALQRRAGIVTVRAQLQRRLPEAFGIGAFSWGIVTYPWIGSTFVRRSDGSWWVRSEPQRPGEPPAAPLMLEGTTLGVTPVPLRDGALLTIHGRPWRFAASG